MPTTKPTSTTRILHAYPTGDHWRGQTVPQIRLQGKWLEAAGIPPGSRVAVEIVADGKLLIRRLEEEA